MKDKKKIIVGIVIVVVLLGVIIGISYAWFTKSITGKKKISIASGQIELIIDNENEGITLNNAIPTEDSDGKEGSAYTFTLRNTGNSDVRYEVYLDNDDTEEETTLEDKDIRYQIKRPDSDKIGTLVETRLIDTGTLKKGEDKAYELRVWLSIDAENDAMGKSFYGKIRVEVIQDRKSEDTSNANAPELASNMIPVEYNGVNWVKASDNTWYDYDRGKWANAVTVSSDTREKYKKADAGAAISMEDVNTMWVWIPRYSYTIAGDGENYYGKKGTYLDHEPTQALPGEIDIKFVGKDTTDRGSAKYLELDKVSGWYTPDAFTFDGKELSGVWVGKFETSNKEADYESNSDSLTPIIKPKVTSWRNIKVSTLETVALKMSKESNIYGFLESEVDTHAMKGSEWALAAYLSQSKYGKLGNRSYSGENKEIYMNAYTGYQTGCSYGGPTFPNSSGEDTCSYQYDDLKDRGDGLGSGGGGASTTGNIYGIYDMNGGSWEYVMSNFNGYTGNTKNLNSGYTGMLTDGSPFEGIPYPNEKYYDKYLTTGISLTSYALGETAGWYRDYQTMVSSTYPWQVRSGSRGAASSAGMFGFYYATEAGSGYISISFRLVLVNQ